METPELLGHLLSLQFEAMHQFGLNGKSIRPDKDRSDLFKAFMDLRKDPDEGVIIPLIDPFGSILKPAFRAHIVTPRSDHDEDLTVLGLMFNENWVGSLVAKGVDPNTKNGQLELDTIERLARPSLFASLSNLGFLLQNATGLAVTRAGYNVYIERFNQQRENM